MRIAFAETLADVDALHLEWEALERRTPEATGFQSFGWCRHWLKLAADRERGRVAPFVVTVRDAAGRLIMLWPLQRASYAGLRVVRWIGEPMTQYGDVLAEPSADRRDWQGAVSDAVRSRRDVDLLLMRNVRADGVLVLGSETERMHHERIASSDVAPYVDLQHGSLSALLDAHLARLRRRRKRLSARGALAFETCADPDARARAVRTALELKRAWLRHKGLFSRGLSHRLSATFLETLAREGDLAVSVLRVGESIAAVELGLWHGTAYRSLLSAFDLKFADGAPGHCLTTWLVATARDRGLRRFDFLAPGDDYKIKWASGGIGLCSTAIAVTWRGRVGLIGVRMRPYAKRCAALLTRAQWHWRAMRRYEPAPIAEAKRDWIGSTSWSIMPRPKFACARLEGPTPS